MRREAVRRPRARFDIDETAFYIACDNAPAGARFLHAVENTLGFLLEMPKAGRRREIANPDLRGLRQYPIRGFGNWLIFYRPIDGGIEVIRVLHGARDIDAILAEETPE